MLSVYKLLTRVAQGHRLETTPSLPFDISNLSVFFCAPGLISFNRNLTFKIDSVRRYPIDDTFEQPQAEEASIRGLLWVPYL